MAAKAKETSAQARTGGAEAELEKVKAELNKTRAELEAAKADEDGADARRADGAAEDGGRRRGRDTSDDGAAEASGIEALRRSDMMAHLLDALDEGTDIGHYGKLVFAMVARHFLDEEDVVTYLQKATDTTEEQARALYLQVQDRDYNPPRRPKVLEWQKQQDFPICPNSDDPDACDVYRDLQFPDEVYEHIAEYREHKAEAGR